jgi:uridine phosphorylase
LQTSDHDLLAHFASSRVANRIITVGDFTRARRISKSFDGGKAIFEFESQRKFLTLTGTFSGVPLTVVAIGMGFSVSAAKSV